MQNSFPWRQQHPPAIAHPEATPATEYIMAQQPEEPRLRDYWKILVKRRRLIVVIFLVGFSLVVRAFTG